MLKSPIKLNTIISIITPSFNQGNFIEETILSVLNQSYKNIEYFIIDGGSTDNTIEIIKKYEHKINFWISEQDKGQSDAINKGLKRATGDIVAWLNSDDLYLPDTLQTVATIFENNPEVDVVYGDVEQLYSNGHSDYYSVKEFEPFDFLSRVSIHQPSVFWRRKLHEKVGYLDDTFFYLMDYDLWMRMFFNFKTKKIKRALSIFRIHKNAKTYGNPSGMYLEHRKVFARFANSLKKPEVIERINSLGIYNNETDISYNININFSETIINKLINNYIFNCGLQEYSWGNRKNAYLLLKNVFYSFPLRSIYYLILNSLCLHGKK